MQSPFRISRRSQRIVLAQVELVTVVKSLQAVSEEMLIDRLIERLLIIAVEHAGAVRGFLLLPEADALGIEAEAVSESQGVRVSLRPTPSKAQELPHSVIRYAVRTLENVTLNDAMLPNVFSTMPTSSVAAHAR